MGRYINKDRDITSNEMSSYNDTLILEFHTSRFWSLCVFLERAASCILNFLVPRRFASSTLLKVESFLATRHLSFLQHHSQSLPSVDTLVFCHALNRSSQFLNLKATMKWVIGGLALSVCMQNVHALPQGSINSESSDVSNPLPTATIPTTTAFNSSVSSVQSTSTNALPNTTGVSKFLSPPFGHCTFCQTRKYICNASPKF